MMLSVIPTSRGSPALCCPFQSLFSMKHKRLMLTAIIVRSTYHVNEFRVTAS
jgi:hypothetical protein